MLLRLVILAGFCAVAAWAPALGQTIEVDTAHPLATFRPGLALGSTVDKEPAGNMLRLYSPGNVRAMLDAGYGWLSYRLFTELVVQDWHWNPAGTFSQGDNGYWTSSASTARSAIIDSFGYRLPHRGFTTDQGANEDYSRLDDGDPSTYWKSNPYLTSRYTGEPDATHPQWVIVDLGSTQPVDAASIRWSSPYATDFAVQYWTGIDTMNDPAHGRWITFNHGAVTGARGGDALMRLSASPQRVRFIRVLMTASSNTCDSHGFADPRNCAGYAIDEIGIGTLGAHGRFHDGVRHTRGQSQTRTYVSSVDPWHAATNRVRNQEQPGLDLIARSGLLRGLGGTFPVPMLYSTPQNAVNEIAYLRARGYPIERVELGEEPDGQYVMPEDDAALYVQWAHALHRFDPTLKLGGPVFQGVTSDVQTWPDSSGNVSWLQRFLQYLRHHGAMKELSFMSFEHYPFDGCEHGAKLLADLKAEPGLVRTIVNVWRSDGLPASIPMYITEANFSAVNFTQTTMQIEGALWQADYMASALSNGVRGAVYYQYEPVPISQNQGCPRDWGNLTMFVAGTDAIIRARAAQFYAGRMLTEEWVVPGTGVHKLYRAALSANDGLVTAYPVKRPDGSWSILIVNKDSRAHTVRVHFGRKRFAGTVTRVSFGRTQYVWRSRGAASKPDPDRPPVTLRLPATADGRYVIPAQSVTVLRGTVP